MEHHPAIPQPLLQRQVPDPAGTATAPLRACLLSGGASRRMGTDKALLPHPEGGTWLERTLRVLAQLDLPITLLSRHAPHLVLAQALAEAEVLPQLEILAEPPPWEGPLLALHRLMERHPEQRLLLCPVDMPDLSRSALQALRRAAEAAPGAIHLAQDGERLQPLLAVLPASAALRQHLAAAVDRGNRRLQGWLEQHPHRPVPLDPQALRNCNRPQDISLPATAAAPLRPTGPGGRVARA